MPSARRQRRPRYLRLRLLSNVYPGRSWNCSYRSLARSRTQIFEILRPRGFYAGGGQFVLTACEILSALSANGALQNSVVVAQLGNTAAKFTHSEISVCFLQGCSRKVYIRLLKKVSRSIDLQDLRVLSWRFVPHYINHNLGYGHPLTGSLLESYKGERMQRRIRASRVNGEISRYRLFASEPRQALSYRLQEELVDCSQKQR
jgi:hypothetical protein